MRTLGGVLSVALAWLIVQLPTVVQACSVCTAGRDEENATAFLLSTVFMSVLPLIAIGTLVYVLWRRIQKLEAETAISSTAVPRTEP
jgi:hypothetical protein